MSKLSEYLKSTGKTQSEFASELGLTQGFVSRLCRGMTGVTLETALRIESATNGQVPVSSLVKREVA